VKDPWEDLLEDIPKLIEIDAGYVDGYNRKETVTIIHVENRVRDKERTIQTETVAAADLMKYLLEIPISHQTTASAMRLSAVMKQLGWHRHGNGQVYIGGKRQKGYTRSRFLKDGETGATRF
jgi:hypothetical protein